MMIKIDGIITSKGFAIGVVQLLKKHRMHITAGRIDDVDHELKAFDSALEKSKEQVREIIKTSRITLGEKESQIFEAHLMLLEDEEFISPMRDQIKDDAVNAPYAVEQTSKQMQSLFRSMDSSYMQERAADIRDLGNRIIRNLLGVNNETVLTEKTILFCEDLEPSDTAMLDPEKVVGFVTEKGGKTSHSAIIAQGLGIPALTGVKAELHDLKDGDLAILDGESGCLFVRPDTLQVEKYSELIQQRQKAGERYQLTQFVHGMTADGTAIEVAANIADSGKAQKAVDLGADGVGLFRTEFLYMNRDSLPSVEEQFNAYRQALEAFGDKPMVIRTFDIGGDKQVDYLNLESEMNPFLGYRAIRISLDRTEMFKDQIRALTMASVYGNLKVMFPMVSTIEEVKQIKAYIREVREELDAKGVAHKPYEIGIMVEIPAVAVEAEKFAKHVDFFSIGTNDLLQYTVAVDRMNEKLSHLYNWYHPGLLRLIHMTATAAKKAGIWVGICGEAAADPLLLPFYVASGIDELSMSAGKISEVKWKLSQLRTDVCSGIDVDLLELETAEDVVSYLGKITV